METVKAFYLRVEKISCKPEAGLTILHNVMPQTAEECEDFFQDASERISARGQRIITAVKEKPANWERRGSSPEDPAEKMEWREEHQ